MKERSMLKLVVTPRQAIDNIERFEGEVGRSSALRDRLAYARAWYAHRKANGGWSFGPSKFIAYEGLDAETYLQAAEESDGRRTEAQLQPWFKRVDPET